MLSKNILRTILQTILKTIDEYIRPELKEPIIATGYCIAVIGMVMMGAILKESALTTVIIIGSALWIIGIIILTVPERMHKYASTTLWKIFHNDSPRTDAQITDSIRTRAHGALRAMRRRHHIILQISQHFRPADAAQHLAAYNDGFLPLHKNKQVFSKSILCLYLPSLDIIVKHLT